MGEHIMLSGSAARIGVAVVVVASVAAAAFRVTHAPDHRRQRQEIARNGCVAAGGEWITTDKSDFCKAAKGSSND
jgi:hypothetical protein